MSPGNQIEAPPPGEELHLPDASIVPLLNAVGISMALIGIAFHWTVSVAGAVLWVWTTVRWIRETVRDVDRLPLEHH